MVDFIRNNPAAEGVRRSIDEGNRQAIAEEEAFRRRAAYEQANAADRALREGIGAFYASQQPQGAPAPAAGPAPAPAPAPAPQAPAAPVQEVEQANPIGFADSNEMPPPGSTAVQGGPQAAPAAGPAATNAPVQPVQGQPRPDVRSTTPPISPTTDPRRTDMRPVIDKLVKAPGGGQTALSLFSADRAQRTELAKLDRQTKLDGMKEFLAAIKDGDPQLARFTAQQYNLGVPDVFFSDRSHMMRARVATATADKLFGKENPNATLAYVKGYLEAGPGASADQASLAGLNAVKAAGVGGRVAGHYVGEGDEVIMYDRQGNRVQGNSPTALPKARPRANAAGGSVYETKRKAYLSVHPGDNQGALDYAAGRRTVPEAQLRNWVETAVSREEGKQVRPFTPAQRAERRAYYEQAFGIKGAGGATPAAGSPAPGARPPLSSFNRTTATVPAGGEDDEEE